MNTQFVSCLSLVQGVAYDTDTVFVFLVKGRKEVRPVAGLLPLMTPKRLSQEGPAIERASGNVSVAKNDA